MTPETIKPIGPGTAAEPPADNTAPVLAPDALAAAVAAAIEDELKVIEAVYIVVIPPLNTRVLI